MKPGKSPAPADGRGAEGQEEKMNRVRIVVFSLVLALASLGCGLIDRVAGGETAFTNASELWSDVPRMEGLTPSEMEMPLYVKLLIRTAMSQILAGGTGGADWIVFSTDKTSEDVQGFYTNERMAQNGWIARGQFWSKAHREQASLTQSPIWWATCLPRARAS